VLKKTKARDYNNKEHIINQLTTKVHDNNNRKYRLECS